jgi:hypothetical protein
MSFSPSKATESRAPAHGKSKLSKFTVIRSHSLELVFGYSRFEHYSQLVKRVGAGRAECVYLLDGAVGDQRIAREGQTGNAGVRFSAHWNDRELRSISHVAILVGLTESGAVALECLLARQIRHIDRARHLSRGPVIASVDPGSWIIAERALLFFRQAAQMVGIDYLEPASPTDVAAYFFSAAGFRDRCLGDARDRRERQILNGKTDWGPLLALDWGDYVAIAEEREGVFWLLAGSEIRLASVTSATDRHASIRKDLINAGQAAVVRGCPDRLEILADLAIGGSKASLTKFALGGVPGDPNRWLEFSPAPAPDALLPSSPTT